MKDHSTSTKKFEVSEQKHREDIASKGESAKSEIEKTRAIAIASASTFLSEATVVHEKKSQVSEEQAKNMYETLIARTGSTSAEEFLDR